MTLEEWVGRHRLEGHHPHPAPTSDNPERWECKCDPDAVWTAVWRILTPAQVRQKFAHLSKRPTPAREAQPRELQGYIAEIQAEQEQRNAAVHTADAVGAFIAGVRLVELGELRDGSAVVDVVAASLGLRDEAATPLTEVLIEYLSPRKLLLVLDNCEQVVDAAAKLAEALLRACPDLRILATSREGLGIGGEVVLPLSPLADDAVILFAERAADAAPDRAAPLR